MPTDVNFVEMMQATVMESVNGLVLVLLVLVGRKCKYTPLNRPQIIPPLFFIYLPLLYIYQVTNLFQHKRDNRVWRISSQNHGG